jgi:hypothetical protein
MDRNRAHALKAHSLGPDPEDRHTVTLTANDRCIKSNFANEHQLISLS